MSKKNLESNKYNIQKVQPESSLNMRGAGIKYKDKKYITHTTLDYTESAFLTFSFPQLVTITILILLLGISYIYDPFKGMRIIVTILSVFYFLDTLFNLYLVLISLKKSIEVTFDHQELLNLDDKTLPIYSILCPLYKEADIVPQFLKSIKELEWPKQKLDVMLLLEEDDFQTISIIRNMNLPDYIRLIIVPDSFPKTKPKACNYGLSYALGKYLVIYDAEDIPEPMQLKKAYLGFKTLPQNVRCLQAKLNYYNPNQNLLTKLFTSEYSLWFGLTLTGLQSLNAVIPLGGTSNHFRTNDLHYFQGWDPFNVTEDADLGVRLFRKGYKTAIIESTTLEEANSNIANWFRQRSRWIKGYMQTYLVHNRNILKSVKENGLWQFLIFELTVGGKVLFLLVNPVMWFITFSYFVFYDYTARIIEYVFYPPISYVAVFSWIFGNFLFIYYYMIACGKRKQWDLIKYIIIVPFYWAMMSIAAVIAIYQLIFKPHYWEKTVHGLHLDKVNSSTVVSEKPKIPLIFPKPVYAYKKKSILPAFNKVFILSSYYLLFLTADIYFMFHFYPGELASQYAYISIFGKSVFAIGLILGYSVFRIWKRFRVFKREEREVSILLYSVFLTSWIGGVIFVFQFYPDLPVILGVYPELISSLGVIYLVSMVCNAMSNVLFLYNLKKKLRKYLFISYGFLGIQLILIPFINYNLGQYVNLTIYLAIFNFLILFVLQISKKYSGNFISNVLLIMFGKFIRTGITNLKIIK